MIPGAFACPPSLVRHMADLFGPTCAECGHHEPGAGEYGIWAPFESPPVVVDVGACIGAFARWAEIQWPGCEVHCYEPNPKAHKLLERNVAAMRGPATITKKAVTVATEGALTLYQGKHNLGEAALTSLMAGTEDGVQVETIPVSALPQCDVLKLDCEGEEPLLFLRYCGTHERPAVVLAEYHCPGDMLTFQREASRLGYRIVKVHEHTRHRGVVCLRRETPT